MTDTHKLLLSFALTLVGSGLGTTIAAALLKRRFDLQLERVKAVLERGSRIHDRQVEALLTIHSRLEKATFYLRRATSSGVLPGESQEDLVRKMIEELAAASDEYSRKKLLLSETLTAKVDAFLDVGLVAGLDLRQAMDPTLRGAPVALHLTQQAKDAAYKELPDILRALRTEAKDIIHSDKEK